MRMRWWGLGVGVLAAALLLPVGQASAPAPEPATGDGGPAAPRFVPDEQLQPRTLQDPAVDELSGMAASRRFPGVLYGVNDSGGGPVIYAIDATGATVARLTLPGARARDWEALAPGWDSSGNPVLWVGDIGDNKNNQDRVQLLEVPEPQQLTDMDLSYEDYWITYPDGPHNAEALMVDPSTGQLSVATKGDGKPGGLYRAPDTLRSSGVNALTYVMEVPPMITDGAWELAPSGAARLVLTDYWRLHRLSGSSWVSSVPPLQLQREALAWPWLDPVVANNTVLLGSEGVGTDILVSPVP